MAGAADLFPHSISEFQTKLVKRSRVKSQESRGGAAATDAQGKESEEFEQLNLALIGECHLVLLLSETNT